jgi:hypothetical protein
VKYLLIHCIEESVELSPDEVADVDRSLSSWIETTTRDGANLHGSRLQPAREAASIRERDGELLVTDGPFAETKEQVAGYNVIECADLDAAIELAAAHPTARIGTIEVRPFWQP